MAKKAFAFCLIFITSNLLSQKLQKTDYSDDFLSKSLNNSYIDTTEYLKWIENFDLSMLWKNSKYSEYIVGFIGNNYQRFQIHIFLVIKDLSEPTQYFIYGKTKAMDNICEFMGTTRLLHVRKYKKSEIDTITQGFVIAKYEFFENPRQPHTGIFKGILKSNWYVTSHGKIKYDDLTVGADGYENNEFVGIWEEYDTKKQLTCNWGEFKIPYPGELDIGEIHFSPNEKYLMNGWESYKRAYVNGDQKALLIEQIDWWKY